MSARQTSAWDQLSTTQRRMLLRGHRIAGKLSPLTFGDHSTARVLIRKKLLKAKWDDDAGKSGADRIYWVLTPKATAMVEQQGERDGSA